MKTFAFACLVAVASAAGKGDWGYLTNGADWGAQCASGKNQSPIDLKSKVAAGEKANLTVKAENFTNADGFKSYIGGTKAGAKPHSAVYLERDSHPDGEIEADHLKRTGACASAADNKIELAKLRSKGIKCLQFNGKA